MVTGTVPLAATVRAFVPGGTSQFGCAESDSGSATWFTSLPSSSCRTRPLRRASAKKSFAELPVLVTVMVAVTGWPARSTLLAELGMP
jgi:hypothetical protein